MSRRQVKHLDPKRTEQLDEAMGLLHFAFRAVVAEADRRLARRGLSRVHNRILFFIARNGTLSVGELLRILEVTKQALHRPLQQLVDAGLVTSSPAPENRRIRRLRLTSEGAAFERQIAGVQHELFAAAFAEAGAAREAAWRQVMTLLSGADPFGRDRLGAAAEDEPA